MSGHKAGWTMALVALSLSLVGLHPGALSAHEVDGRVSNASIVSAPNAASWSSSTGIALQHHHAYAPPPRRRYYRPYRPRWSFRILPPPIFAPGWFGIYFLGRPAPAAPREAPTESPPAKPAKPDFRHVGEYSLSMTGGGLSGFRYIGGNAYAETNDAGLRLALNYRKTPVVGSEISVGLFGTGMRLDDNGSEARTDVPIQLSAVFHLFPRAPIQPYVLFGGTATLRNWQYVYDDGTLGDPYSELRVGPHLGFGLEVLIGDRVGITLDGRRIIYTMVDREVIDQSGLRDGTFTGGLNLYF